MSVSSGVSPLPDDGLATNDNDWPLRTCSPVDAAAFDRHTPDSTVVKRSRRSSITESADFSIGRFSFEDEKFAFEGELRDTLEKHIRQEWQLSPEGVPVPVPATAPPFAIASADDDDEDAQEDQSAYPPLKALILILIALCLAVFCVSTTKASHTLRKLRLSLWSQFVLMQGYLVMRGPLDVSGYDYYQHCHPTHHR